LKAAVSAMCQMSGWVIIRWYTISHPGQLSILLSAGWKMSTGQIIVTLCGCEVKTGMAHSTCGLNMRVSGKTVDRLYGLPRSASDRDQIVYSTVRSESITSKTDHDHEANS